MESKKYTVLQANAISRAVYKCTPLERQLLAFATMELKQKNNIYQCCFTFKDFIEAAPKMTQNGYERDIEHAVKTLFEKHNSIIIQNENDNYIATVWLQKVTIQNKEIYFQFSDEIGKRLFSLKASFTILDFSTIAVLQSYYSIRLYELIKSYNGFLGRGVNKANEYYFNLSMDEIRNIFQLSKTKKVYDITRRVITPAIDELNAVLQPTKINAMQFGDRADARRIGGYCFVVQKDTAAILPQNPRRPPLHREKEIETMKSIYFNEYVKTAAKMDKKGYETQYLYDCKILDILKKQGYRI